MVIFAIEGSTIYLLNHVFGDVLRHSVNKSLLLVAFIATTAPQQIRTNPLTGFKATHNRHINIKQDDTKVAQILTCDELYCLHSVLSDLDLKFVLKKLCIKLQLKQIIINNE